MRLLIVLLTLLSAPLLAQQGTTPPAPADPGAAGEPASKQDPDAAAEPKSLEQLLARYHPKTGTVAAGTMARVRLLPGWLFLAGVDGRSFLHDRGNQPGASTLGVAVPPDFAASRTFAVYQYADEGHVDDSENVDFDELLRSMKESAVEESKQRKSAGLSTVELLGWAEPPHYDKAQHKLYWAEKLKFADSDGLTVNYNVRVLGRSGYLVVNGVGDFEQLRLVDQRNQELLAVTEFVEGQRYENFDPKLDKLAEYGIGGLIAGGIALKFGLFAKLGVLLKVAIKPILVGVVLIGAFFARLLGLKKKKEQGAGDAPSA